MDIRDIDHRDLLRKYLSFEIAEEYQELVNTIEIEAANNAIGDDGVAEMEKTLKSALHYFIDKIIEDVKKQKEREFELHKKLKRRQALNEFYQDQLGLQLIQSGKYNCS